VTEQPASHNSLSDLVQRMTPGQRLRLRKLLDEYAALKLAVLYPTTIDVAEPCLASPRSSLNAERLSTFALDDEVRDKGLTAQANRASYQAAESSAYVRSRRYGDEK
jgi:hypothetical protein